MQTMAMKSSKKPNSGLSQPLYRPILISTKSFQTTSDQSLRGTFEDIKPHLQLKIHRHHF